MFHILKLPPPPIIIIINYSGEDWQTPLLMSDQSVRHQQWDKLKLTLWEAYRCTTTWTQLWGSSRQNKLWDIQLSDWPVLFGSAKVKKDKVSLRAKSRLNGTKETQQENATSDFPLESLL